jgi:hypothetical protein
MECMFSSVSGTTTTTVISTASANSHLVWLDTPWFWSATISRTSLRSTSIQLLHQLVGLVKLGHGLAAHAVGNGGRVVAPGFQLACHVGKLLRGSCPGA